MGQKYAGILGMLASTLAIVRGLLAGAGMESTILVAMGSLFGGAAAGWLAGIIAETLVEQAVRRRFEAAMNEARE